MKTRILKTIKHRLLIILTLAALAAALLPGVLPANPPAIASGPGIVQPAGYSWGG
jgi:hypothetical protein